MICYISKLFYDQGVLNLTNAGGANRKTGGANKQPGSSCSVAGQPEDIGIIRHSGPANSKYSTVEARTRTFREWPPALRQQPAQLSEAGFFYIGLSDQGIVNMVKIVIKHKSYKINKLTYL